MRQKIFIHRVGHGSSRTAGLATTIGLIGFTLLLVTDSANGSLLINGSFEQNAFFNERAGFPRLDDVNGSTPTGWTRDGVTLAEYLTRSPLYLGITLYNPDDADYFIGMHGGEWWEQTFATVSNTTYELSYSFAYGAVWWESLPGYFRPGSSPGAVTLTGNNLLFSGGVVGTGTAPTGTTLLDSPFIWSQDTVTFTADSNSTTLRFAGPANVDDGYVFFDKASVTAVPEPSSWIVFLGLGLGLVELARRKTSLFT